jgi:replicative DNA helicase
MDISNLNIDRKTRRKSAGAEYNPMMLGKIPPQAKELEEAVLGAVMLEKSAFDTVVEILQPQCFYVDAHQRIFNAFVNLAKAGEPIDILTVVEALRKSEELEIVGGAYFITKLTNQVVSSANLEAHARIVLQKFIQRTT